MVKMKKLMKAAENRRDESRINAAGVAEGTGRGKI